MKIEIDFEAILREEIAKFLKENISISSVTIEGMASAEVTTSVGTTSADQSTTKPASQMGTIPDWEFAPRVGRRRSKAEMKMHEMELSLGRRLTPAEKGETDAKVELDEEAEIKAKDDTKKKAHIDEMVEEGTAAAAKELAEEAEQTSETKDPTVDAAAAEASTEASDTGINSMFDTQPEAEAKADTPAEEGPVVPKADGLDNVNSLFS